MALASASCPHGALLAPRPVSVYSRAEGVWRCLSPLLRSAVLLLLLLRGAPLKLCAGSSTGPGAAPPRTPPRSARNRHGHLGSPFPASRLPGTSLPPVRKWRAGGGAECLRAPPASCLEPPSAQLWGLALAGGCGRAPASPGQSSQSRVTGVQNARERRSERPSGSFHHVFPQMSGKLSKIP